MLLSDYADDANETTTNVDAYDDCGIACGIAIVSWRMSPRTQIVVGTFEELALPFTNRTLRSPDVSTLTIAIDTKEPK